MINIRSLKKLTNNDGLTLKKGNKITYKTGYQVATEGIETTDPRSAMKAIKAYGGNCGVWFSEGVYYVDKSHRVSTICYHNLKSKGELTCKYKAWISY